MDNVSLMSSFSLLFPGLIAEDTISPEQDEVSGTEGESVTLRCNYQTDSNANDYFFWYRQHPEKPPEFLLYHYGTQNATSAGLSVTVSDDKNHINMKISSAAVSDSAVYYCALQPTVTGNNKTVQKPLEQIVFIFKMLSVNFSLIVPLFLFTIRGR
uniref:Ig-like domain-containing protein n=1 Tax=Amphiprion ocellaris TaxID=80972 RepID=A0AAQ5Z6Z9_AMPOC